MPQEVERFGDRLMKLIIISADRIIHFFIAYAPQTARPDVEKDAFWQLLDGKTCHVPVDDYIIIAHDVNVHVDEKQMVTGAIGERNFDRILRVDCVHIIDFADTHDLALTSTCFIKPLSHLPIFYSGNSNTKIDYILIRRRHLTIVNDCKAFPYEIIAPQHRPLIVVLRIKNR